MKNNLSILSLLGIVLTLFSASCKVNEFTKTETLIATTYSTTIETATATVITTMTSTITANVTIEPSTTSTDTTRKTPLLYLEAPDFELQDLDGNIVTLSQFRGSPVMLTFWKSR